MSDSLARSITATLVESGPLTGQLLTRRLTADALSTWQECRRNPVFEMRSIARHYVRLDERLSGWARLSPSIAREFLTYTVVSLREQREAAAHSVATLRETTTAVGREKLELAQSSMLDVRRRCADVVGTPVAFLIAGDVTYDMAHRAPREEINTGKLVAGSDLDIVAIHADNASADAVQRLDAELTKLKWRLLQQRHQREELDFVVKSLSKAISQLSGGSFRESVASKILLESRFLEGDEVLARDVRAAVETSDIGARVSQLEAFARETRTATEDRLRGSGQPHNGDLTLFHPVEESRGW